MLEAKRRLLSGSRFDKSREHEHAVIVVTDDQARMGVNRRDAANAIGTGRHSRLANNELERNLHNNALGVLSVRFYDQTAQTCQG